MLQSQMASTSVSYTPSSSCKLSGHFTLHGGTIMALSQTPGLPLSNFIIYDTKITATSGSIMNASLVILGRDKFPDGSVICAEAEGGPLRFGQSDELKYMMQATRLIYLSLDPALFNDPKNRYNHVHSSGRVISDIRRMYNGDVAFDLEITTNISHWQKMRKWVIGCIVPPTSLGFIPIKGSLIDVSGVIHDFTSEYDSRRFDAKVSEMRLRLRDD